MKLYVGNLDFHTQSEGLRTAFAAHGEVKSAEVVTDRVSGQPRGFAFVEMPNQAEAKAAMAALDGSQLDGRTLMVNESRPRQGGSGRQGRPAGRSRW